MLETWKPIPGYEGYEASDQGRVRSLPRLGGNNRLYGGTILKPRSGGKNSPYHAVYLGRPPNVRIHQAVLLAFIGQRPEGMICCHNNANKLDNRLENLRYDTPRANVLDRALHGTDNRDERHGMHKLSDAEVRLILNSELDLIRDLAVQFDVSESCIRSILSLRRRNKGRLPSLSFVPMPARSVDTSSK